jgi:hypothetical protein
MPLTEQQYKALLVVELDNAAGILSSQIDIIWTKNDSVTDLDLHYLYARRDAIDLMLTQAANQVSFKALDGASVNLSDVFDHLLKLREQVETSLAEAGGGGGIALGQLTTTAPIQPTAGQSDPNAIRLRGSPIWRR